MVGVLTSWGWWAVENAATLTGAVGDLAGLSGHTSWVLRADTSLSLVTVAASASGHIHTRDASTSVLTGWADEGAAVTASAVGDGALLGLLAVWVG